MLSMTRKPSVVLAVGLVFLFGQMASSAYAVPANNSGNEVWIAPEDNAQTSVMTPATQTTPGEDAYIEGYGPNDVGNAPDVITTDAKVLSLDPEANRAISQDAAVLQAAAIVQGQAPTSSPLLQQAVMEAGGISIAPAVVLDPSTPGLVNVKTLTVTYTVDGVAQNKTFTLAEGENKDLVLTATDAAGNITLHPLPIVTLDTVAPVIIVTSLVPTRTNRSQLTVNYTADGVEQTQTLYFRHGNNTGLVLTARDAAGNDATYALPDIRRDPTVDGYTEVIFDVTPTVEGISPTGTGKQYELYNGAWWTSPPPLSLYSMKDGALSIGLGGELISTPNDQSGGQIPLLPGATGFYVEFDSWISDKNADHWPAIFLLPIEYDRKMSLHQEGDPPGYVRFLEIDVDEGGPSTGWVGATHNTSGIWPQYKHVSYGNPAPVPAIDRTQKHTYGISYDPVAQAVTWWLDGIKQGTVSGETYIPAVASKHNFYVILDATSHGAKIPYNMYVSGMRAYAPTRNPVQNEVPVATAQSVVMDEDTVKVITLSASDPDNNSLTYAVVGQPSHGALNCSGAECAYTPVANYNGVDSFTFKVNDGTGDSDVATMSLTINPVNEAPVMTALNAKNLTQGQSLALTLTASDVDSSPLTYSALNLPAGATFNTSTRTLSWTPSISQIGVYHITFKVTDPSGATDLKTVDIVVRDPANPVMTFHVKQNGTGDFTAIQTAVNAAKAGDTVLIHGGIYYEVVSVYGVNGTQNAPITISGYNGETAVIDGNNSLPASDWGALFNVYGAYVIVKDLEIRNSKWMGLVLNGNHDQAININSNHNQQNGILVQGSADYSIVEGSRAWENSLVNENFKSVTGWSSGLSAARGVKFVTLRNNTVWNNWGEGLSTFETTDVTLEDNVVYDNKLNVYLSDTQRSILRRNLIYNTPGNKLYNSGQAGIALADERYKPPSADNIIIDNMVLGGATNFYSWGGDEKSSDGYYGHFSNILVANNTFVNSVAWPNVKLINGSHTNFRFENNLILQEDSLPISQMNNFIGISFSNNRWSKASTPGFSGAGDVINSNLQMVKTGSAAAGLLTADYFKLLSASPVINEAKVLSEVTEDFFKPARGVSPDIGAYEYMQVTPPNQAPVTTAPAIPGFNENATQAITLFASDADNNPLTYSIVAGPTHGTLVRDPAFPSDPTKYIYTPAENYNGTDSFTYKVNDGTEDSDVVTVSLTINPVNEAPVVVVTSTVPVITNQQQLAVRYTVGGVEQTHAFSLEEGDNTGLVLSAAEVPGNVSSVSLSNVTLDTVPPVMELLGSLPATSTIPVVYVTYRVDGENRMIVLPLVEGDNTDLKINALDAAGNETILRLPNVRYEKPPEVVAPSKTAGVAPLSSAEEDKVGTSASVMSVADFRVYFQSLNLSAVQRRTVNQSLDQIRTGTFVYRYETDSGLSFSWTETGGRTRVFSFENNILLLGDLLAPVLS